MIIGHDNARKRLNREIAAGSVSGAYAFSGPEGVGKFSLALEFAGRLNGSGAIDQDVRVIRPSREESKGIVKTGRIGVGEIRELQDHLALSAAGSRFRIGIIDGAESLTKAAQNALLKTLEEPRSRSLAILVTSRPERLLPTIVSRCHMVRFGLLSEPEILAALKENGFDRADLAEMAMGRPGWAVRMANDEEFLAAMKGSARDLDSVSGSDLNAGFDLAERMAKDKEGAVRELSIWMALLRESLLGRSAGKTDPLRAMKAIESISQASSSLSDTNANARLVLENLFLGMTG